MTSMFSWLLPPKKGPYAVPSMWEALIGLTGSHEEAKSLMTYEGLIYSPKNRQSGYCPSGGAREVSAVTRPAGPENQQGHFEGVNPGDQTMHIYGKI